MAEHNVKLATSAQTAEANAIAALLNGGNILLYHGPRPAFPYIAVANMNPPQPQLLATLSLPNPAFAAASAGFALANAIAAVAPAASGHADWFRATDGGQPAAPVPTTAATGGTVLAGVYGVIVSYTSASGETIGSVAGTVTTTGSTSTLTVPSPAAIPGATGWYAYVTQANGSTYTRQQTAGSPTAIGTALTLTAPPTSSGANPLTQATAGLGNAVLDGTCSADGTGDIQLNAEELFTGVNVSVTRWALWGPYETKE
jgi:hypothetical protein